MYFIKVTDILVCSIFEKKLFQIAGILFRRIWEIKSTHLEHLLPYHAKYQESVQILITMPIFETHLFSYKATKKQQQQKPVCRPGAKLKNVALIPH